MQSHITLLSGFQVGADEGTGDWRMAGDGWQDRLLLKSSIVLGVFPAAFAVFFVLTFPLILLLGVILPKRILEWVLPIITYGFGLGGALWLCWLIWPKSKDEADAQR